MRLAPRPLISPLAWGRVSDRDMPVPFFVIHLLLGRLLKVRGLLREGWPGAFHAASVTAAHVRDNHRHVRLQLHDCQPREHFIRLVVAAIYRTRGVED
jgi:hypothetical protein